MAVQGRAPAFPWTLANPLRLGACRACRVLPFRTLGTAFLGKSHHYAGHRVKSVACCRVKANTILDDVGWNPFSVYSCLSLRAELQGCGLLRRCQTSVSQNKPGFHLSDLFLKGNGTCRVPSWGSIFDPTAFPQTKGQAGKHRGEKPYCADTVVLSFNGFE